MRVLIFKSVLKLKSYRLTQLAQTIYPQLLHYVVENITDPQILKWAIDNAKNINVKHYGYTALHIAVIANNTVAIKLLLDHMKIRPNRASEVDYNNTGSNEENDFLTPLQLAAFHNKLPALLAILTHPNEGINFNKLSAYGTALHIAIFWNNIEIVKALLESEKIDLKVSGIQGIPLFYAIANGTPAIASLFIKCERTDVNAANERGRTPLQVAIIYKKFRAVKELLEHLKIDITLSNNPNLPLLELAMAYYDKKIFCTLLDHRLVNPNQINCQNYNPLTIAILNDYSNALSDLAFHPKTNVNLLSESGAPLFLAIIENKIKAVETLLSCPTIDVNIVHDGLNILFIAIGLNHYQISQMLLAHPGCDLDWYISKEGMLRVQALRQISNLKYHKIDVFKALTSNPRFKINAKNSKGLTNLHLAVINADSVLVKELLEFPGVDVNATETGTLYTPLHEASRNRKLEAVELLLSQPATNINAKTSLGRTPVFQAIEHNAISTLKALLLPPTDLHAMGVLTGGPSDKEAVQQFLNKRKVNLLEPDHQNATPLSMALQKPNVDALQTMLYHRPDNEQIPVVLATLSQKVFAPKLAQVESYFKKAVSMMFSTRSALIKKLPPEITERLLECLWGKQDFYKKIQQSLLVDVEKAVLLDYYNTHPSWKNNSKRKLMAEMLQKTKPRNIG